MNDCDYDRMCEIVTDLWLAFARDWQAKDFGDRDLQAAAADFEHVMATLNADTPANFDAQWCVSEWYEKGEKSIQKREEANGA